MKYYRFEDQIYKVDFDKQEVTLYNITDSPLRPHTDVTEPCEDETIEELIETWINLCEPDFIEISEEEFNELYNEWLRLYNEWENFILQFQVKIAQYELNFESNSDD